MLQQGCYLLLMLQLRVLLIVNVTVKLRVLLIVDVTSEDAAYSCYK